MFCILVVASPAIDWSHKARIDCILILILTTRQKRYICSCQWFRISNIDDLTAVRPPRSKYNLPLHMNTLSFESFSFVERYHIYRMAVNRVAKWQSNYVFNVNSTKWATRANDLSFYSTWHAIIVEWYLVRMVCLWSWQGNFLTTK